MVGGRLAKECAYVRVWEDCIYYVWTNTHRREYRDGDHRCANLFVRLDCAWTINGGRIAPDNSTKSPTTLVRCVKWLANLPRPFGDALPETIANFLYSLRSKQITAER